MNIRKPADYSVLFSELDNLMAAQLPQMELYREIGRLVSGRAEKGAAVAVSEYLQASYPAAVGFSPRNLRRMRAFYAAYEEFPEIMRLAMYLGWTRNVAILERCGSNEERTWYIRAVLHFGWKKAKLLAAIESQAWQHSSLDEQAVFCYTGENEVTRESESDEEDTLCVSWKYLPQPHGRVRDEGLGEKGWAGVAIPYRVGSHQPRGDRQPGLSSGAAQAGGAWNLLQRPCGAPAHQSGFIVLPLEKPCNIRRFRLSNPQTVCTFPCFFPYGLKQGKDFYSPLTTLSSSRAELRFASLVEWA